MRDLPIAIPDVDVLLSLSSEELAAKILFLVRKRGEARFHPDNMKGELWGDPNRGIPGYAQARSGEVELAVAEAWAWLLAQGLVLPEEGMNGIHGFQRLSRRARRMESEADFANFQGGAPASSRDSASEARRLRLARVHAR